jgi:hypothetical protein
VPVTAPASGDGDPFTAAEAWAAQPAPNFLDIRTAGLEREASLPPMARLIWPATASSLLEGQEATGSLVAPTDITIDVRPGWRAWAILADGSEQEVRSGQVDHRIVAVKVRNESCGPNPVLADSAVVVRQTR